MLKPSAHCFNPYPQGDPRFRASDNRYRAVVSEAGSLLWRDTHFTSVEGEAVAIATEQARMMQVERDYNATQKGDN